MKIRPLQDRVVVKRQDEETTSAGGIVLPGSLQKNLNKGKLLLWDLEKNQKMENTPVDLKLGIMSFLANMVVIL